MKNFLIYLTAAIAFIVSCNNKSKLPANSEISTSHLAKYEIKVDGMTCTGCEQTIQSAVSALDGIKKIKASHTEGNAFVVFDTTLTDTSNIRMKIDATGYKVVAFLPRKE